MPEFTSPPIPPDPDSQLVALKPPRKRSRIAVSLAVCAIGMVLGFGTCSVAALSTGNTPGGAQLHTQVAIAGAWVFGASAVGFCITVIAALVYAIVTAFTRRQR